mgnify:FL=1
MSTKDSSISSRFSGWSEWKGTDLDWDQALLELADYNIYQSSSWANHRADFGWNIIRLQNQSPEGCLAQVLTKQILGTTFAWIPGGPVANFDLLTSQFLQCIAMFTGSKRIFVRLNSLEHTNEQSCEKLRKNSWKQVSAPLSTGLSLQYDLTLTEQTRLEMLSTNWSRNLRRGETRNSKPYEWQDFTPEEIASIYGQLSQYKGLDSTSDTPNLAVITSIVANCKTNLKIFRCDDEQGNALAIRGALLLGNKAWDIFAAATPQGRKQYSSYTTAWSLFNSCADSQITQYDLSGIDPVKNKGVYDFKHGTGATEIKYVGEWDNGTPFYVQPLVGRLIRYRKNL